jgi:hypothetical protein
MQHRLVSRALFVLLIMHLVACTKDVPGVCCIDAADCSEIGISDIRGCSDGLVCIEHECSVPPPGACMNDMDCGSAAPHCGADGNCVVCLQSDQCSSDAPVCDASSHDCRGCAADSECSSEVCEIASGQCANETDIAYATPAGSDGAACTHEDPCSIAHAFAVVTATRKTVHLAPGAYAATLKIGNKSVRVIGFGATVSDISGVAPFEVTAGGGLELVGVAVSNLVGTDAAIRCNGSATSLVLDRADVDAKFLALLANPCLTATISGSRVRVRNVGGFQVLSENSSISVDRSRFDGAGAIVATGSGGAVRLTNSIVAVSNGVDGPFGYTAFGAPLGAVLLSFSTVLTGTPVKTPASVSCSGSLQGLCIDNSVIINASAGAPTDTVTGTGCNAAFSIVFPQATAIGGSNNLLGMNPVLLDPPNGDVHLKLGSPAIDAADPASSNTIDFDGIARPQGARRDIGAYELVP